MEAEILAKVKENAVSRLGWSNAATTNLYIENEPIKPGTTLRAYLQDIPVNRETVMVFADDAPLFNWGHRCRYMLYDSGTADLYNEVAAEFPPYLTEVPASFERFHEPVRYADSLRIYPVKPRLWFPRIVPKGVRYAVLYSGASNNRHTNDLEFLYRILIDAYDFKTENIYCLNYDGTINYSGGPKPVGNWPGDDTPYRMPVTGEGTRAALDAVIDELKLRIKGDDLLLIHTNNHGGWSGWGQSYLCTYSGPAYFAADFASKLAELPEFYCLMTMMEQCHSGGFNSYIVAQSPAKYTTVSSACIEQNSSIGGSQFDPFARDWIAGMAGHMPNGGALASNPDVSGNGRVSAIEAHEYANSIHDPYDTPTYNENVAAAGDTYLGRRYTWSWWWKPWIAESLRPKYERMPLPEFYAHLRENVIPKLNELGDEVERRFEPSSPDMENKVKQLAEKSF